MRKVYLWILGASGFAALLLLYGAAPLQLRVLAAVVVVGVYCGALAVFGEKFVLEGMVLVVVLTGIAYGLLRISVAFSAARSGSETTFEISVHARGGAGGGPAPDVGQAPKHVPQSLGM